MFDPGHREDDAAIGQGLAEFLEGVERGDVDLVVGFRVQQEPFDGLLRPFDGGQGPALEVLGVGEEQRGVVAVDEKSGHLPGVG